MTTFRAPIAVAAVVLILAGCQASPSSSSEPSAPAASSEAPSSAPDSSEPTGAALASGSFTANLGSWGQSFDIEATGSGDDVSGTLEVTHPDAGNWSADLQCSRTADEGLLVIAGQVTESTNETFAEGAYAALLLAPGTPVRTILWLDDEAAPADSCTAFLDTIFSDPEFGGSAEGMFPISGDLELAS